MKNYSKLELAIIDHIQTNVEQYLNTDVCDLHNNLFNTDYWVVGTYAAKEEISKHCEPFNALDIVYNYEKDNFGEHFTDFTDVEKVCNMLVYILGEQILNSLPCMSINWNDKIDQDFIDKLISETANLI